MNFADEITQHQYRYSGESIYSNIYQHAPEEKSLQYFDIHIILLLFLKAEHNLPKSLDIGLLMKLLKWCRSARSDLGALLGVVVLHRNQTYPSLAPLSAKSSRSIDL